MTDLAALQRFVAAESLPLVIEFSSITQQQIFSAAHPLQVVLLHGSDETEQV